MVINTDIISALQFGKLKIEGEFVWGSNYTFLVQVEYNGLTFRAVYKPTRGEQPLWDFPVASLAKRETAAYWVSQALGWDLVPPTVYRLRGPIGAGSLQLYIEHDPEYHYFKFSEEDRQRLRPTAVFDILVNNADRKGSHILFDPDRHIWLIDHGICFHVEEKLRTVVWDFSGQSIPTNLIEDLKKFKQKLAFPQNNLPQGSGLPKQNQTDSLYSILLKYLSRNEIKALDQRASRLIELGNFPAPDFKRRPYPWPAY